MKSVNVLHIHDTELDTVIQVLLFVSDIHLPWYHLNEKLVDNELWELLREAIAKVSRNDGTPKPSNLCDTVSGRTSKSEFDLWGTHLGITVVHENKEEYGQNYLALTTRSAFMTLRPSNFKLRVRVMPVAP